MASPTELADHDAITFGAGAHFGSKAGQMRIFHSTLLHYTYRDGLENITSEQPLKFLVNDWPAIRCRRIEPTLGLNMHEASRRPCVSESSTTSRRSRNESNETSPDGDRRRCDGCRGHRNARRCLANAGEMNINQNYVHEIQQ